MACKVEGCTKQGKLKKSGKRIFVKGYCTMHYDRLIKYGDINVFKFIVGENRMTDNRYTLYRLMVDRCTNKKSKAYYNYGGRGIIISDRWVGPYGFTNFCKDMGERKKGLSLDRIDVNGNYEPNNCRWANNNEQQGNRRNNNQVVGVQFVKGLQKWTAQLETNGKRFFLGNFINFEDAVKARKEAEKKYIKRHG